MTVSTERDRIRERLDVLRRMLPRLEEMLGPVRFAVLAGEMEPWLARFQRASTEPELRELAAQLRMFESRHDIRHLLDHEAQQSLLGARLGPTRGPDRPSRDPEIRSLFAQLRRHLHLDRPAALTAFPALHAPAEVRLNTAFEVKVSAHREADPGAAPPMVLTRRRPGPVDLEVELVLPADESIEARTWLRQPLRIPEEGAAMVLRFELVARRLGGHRIEAVFRHEGVEQDRLAATVLVKSAEEMAEAPETVVGGGFIAAGGAPRPLVLQIDHRGGDGPRRFDRVILTGERLPVPADAVRELARDTRPILTDLCREVGAAREPTPRARELALRGIGQRLAKELLPDAVLAELRPDRFPVGTALHIESDDAWAPWELAWLGPMDKGVFLGEHFAVTRRIHEGGSVDVLADGDVVLVAPVCSKLDATRERDALRALRGGKAPVELRGLEETLELLNGSVRYGVLHFASHGAARPQEAFGGILPLDGGLLRELHVPALDRVTRTGPLAGALVFLNACEVGLDGAGLTGHGGWARAFLKAGAVAFVAPSWVVADAAAIRFATTFYEHLRQGRTLGEAGRLARIAAHVEGEPSGLGYAVYASPHARDHRAA